MWNDCDDWVRKRKQNQKKIIPQAICHSERNFTTDTAMDDGQYNIQSSISFKGITQSRSAHPNLNWEYTRWSVLTIDRHIDFFTRLITEKWLFSRLLVFHLLHFNWIAGQIPMWSSFTSKPLEPLNAENASVEQIFFEFFPFFHNLIFYGVAACVFKRAMKEAQAKNNQTNKPDSHKRRIYN